MKLVTNNSETFSSHTIEQREFKITASAKAFKILSSNLYRNKIRAIIRELSANAFDAHISIGQPTKQFQVHLPSTIDPIFWLRDFGTGLSKEQVFSLYTTYFESTKAESNDFVGALGLGSKSPFSYVDSFTVTSFFNGEKTVYDMSLKGGVPNVAELYSGSTEEENGILISLSVNDTDYNRFRQEAQYVFKTFATKPEFVGNQCDVEMSGVVDHGGYFVTSDSMFSGVYALMGNIPYPVPDSMFEKTVIGTMSKQRGVFIKFNLGELDITPSREELSYDPETENVLNERVDMINAVLLHDVIEKYKDETQPRDAHTQINGNELHGLRNVIREKVIVDGKSIQDWIDELTWDNKDSDGSKQYYRRVEFYNGEPRCKWRGKNSWDNDDLAAIHRTDIDIFLNDDKKSPLQTLRGLHKLGKFKSHVVWMFDTHSASHKEVADRLISLWGTHKGCNVLVNSEVSKEAQSALPKAEKVSRGKALNSETYTLNLGMVSSSKCQFYVDDIKSYTGLYAYKFYDAFVDENESVVMDEETLKAFMIASGTKEVIIVRKAHWKHIMNNPNAKSVQQSLIEYVDNSSGKMIALKYGSSGVALPSWTKRIDEIFPKFIVDMMPKRKYNHKHKSYDLFECLSRQFFGSMKLTKNGYKQVKLFKGKRLAIQKNATGMASVIDAKYEFLRIAVSNIYSTEKLKSFKNELKVLINLK